MVCVSLNVFEIICLFKASDEANVTFKYLCEQMCVCYLNCFVFYLSYKDSHQIEQNELNALNIQLTYLNITLKWTCLQLCCTKQVTVTNCTQPVGFFQKQNRLNVAL